MAFITEGSGTSGAPALTLLPRPQQQHQYQQTDKCTVLKLDVLKQQSGVAANSSSNTYLQIEQQLSELEAADEEEENMASLLGSAPPAQILANQPIIVKIEPTQSFHIVDEGDTRVLSLPLSDADKLGASWIDLKDIAGLQAGGGATLLDVCFEQANEDGTIIATVQPDLENELEAELKAEGEPEDETEPEPPAPKRLATTRPAQSRPQQQQQQQQQVKFLSDPPALARSSSFSSLSSFSSISNISSVCKNMASNTSQEGSLKRTKERTPPPMPPLTTHKPAATSTATSAAAATSAATASATATSARENSREHSSSGSSSNGAMTGMFQCNSQLYFSQFGNIYTIRDDNISTNNISSYAKAMFFVTLVLNKR